jgi:N-methylhydantoinase A
LTPAQRRFRISSDTGGTFTDLVVEDERGEVRMFKAATVPDDPAAGILQAIGLAARSYGIDREELLVRTDLLVHGTTHAINAIITGRTATTAFITSEGHPDILTLREGGRADPFDHRTAFPKPYIPRRLTFEVPGRIDWQGRVIRPFHAGRVKEIIDRLRAEAVEAVAVCLLWSVTNPEHELRVAELLAEQLPEVAVSLSHRLNPTIREYRRASSTCIDASLKPIMSRYLGGLRARLHDAGFKSTLMMVTSQGAMVDAAEVALAPIKAINSGPAMAPVAGAYFTREFETYRDVIVADTGGTTYDVSLVRGGEIPFTREAWIGKPHLGHMTGFPSIDVKSVGAGGGSIAWIDDGGVLHIGPKSVGAVPGPACYGKQSEFATVSDAALILGYIDPDFFLGGAIHLDRSAAAIVLQRNVADRLDCDLDEAAASVMEVATENMAQAIIDICVDQGVDPQTAMLVGGGGAAGLNSIFIARRLGCSLLIIPELGAALSATGGLLSEIATEFRRTTFFRSECFDIAGANGAIDALRVQADQFLARAPAEMAAVRFYAEARYPRQAWEIPIPLRADHFSQDIVAELLADFHAAHLRIYAVNDPASPIEILGFAVRVSTGERQTPLGRVRWPEALEEHGHRSIYILHEGRAMAPVYRLDRMPRQTLLRGPALVESPFTSVVLDSACQFQLSAEGSLVVHLEHPKGKVTGA